MQYRFTSQAYSDERESSWCHVSERLNRECHVSDVSTNLRKQAQPCRWGPVVYAWLDCKTWPLLWERDGNLSLFIASQGTREWWYMLCNVNLFCSRCCRIRLHLGVCSFEIVWLWVLHSRGFGPVNGKACMHCLNIMPGFSGCSVRGPRKSRPFADPSSIPSGNSVFRDLSLALFSSLVRRLRNLIDLGRYLGMVDGKVPNKLLSIGMPSKAPLISLYICHTTRVIAVPTVSCRSMCVHMDRRLWELNDISEQSRTWI